MTKERKIYAVVLGLFAVGFAVDQLFFEGEATGPSNVEAVSPIAPDAGSVADVVKKMNQAAATLEDKQSLAYRLEQFAQMHQYDLPHVTNVFEPSSAWVAKPQAQAAQVSRLIAAFSQRHQLIGVMLTSQGGVAMVQTTGAGKNGAARTAVQVGQSIDGFVLQSVTGQSATFGADNQTMTLDLELPAGAEASSPSTPQPAGSQQVPSLLNLPSSQ